MTSTPEIPIGDRVRFYRKARNKTQTVVAGLAGITEDYLGQIERGVKTPTIAILHKLARILGVPVSALLGEPTLERDSRDHPVASALHRALLTPSSVEDANALDHDDVKQRVEDAWTTWQSSPRRYTEISSVLPKIVTDVQTLVRATPPGDALYRPVHQTAADLYFLLRTFTKRIGRVDLSLLVADRGRAAAEAADDPLRMAAATWNLAHVLLAQDETENAEEIALEAIDTLNGERADDQRDAAAVTGALWLTSSVAAARRGDTWAARDRIREHARSAAQQAGERNAMWTAFGPTNVQLHAVSIDMEAGEASEALRLAGDVNIEATTSIERRTTFALEVARCYEQRHEDAAVLIHLLTAETTGPEDMLYNSLARDLVRGLLKRARPTYGHQVRTLANRLEVYA